MQIVKFVAMALLFALLTPGVILSLPIGASRKVTAIVHGFVFALVWYLASELLDTMEGFSDVVKPPHDEDKKSK